MNQLDQCIARYFTPRIGMQGITLNRRTPQTRVWWIVQVEFTFFEMLIPACENIEEHHERNKQGGYCNLILFFVRTVFFNLGKYTIYGKWGIIRFYHLLYKFCWGAVYILSTPPLLYCEQIKESRTIASSHLDTAQA